MDYIPITEEDKRRMLKVIGVADIESLFSDIPEEVRQDLVFNSIHQDGLSEFEVISELEKIAGENRNISEFNSFLGGGIYNHFIPSIVDAIISRPEFYTAYTPYQAEVSQGTLQGIFEFQTFISELMGLDIANASMYDGGTASAEALILTKRIKRRNKVAVSKGLNPEYRKVIETYLKHTGIEVVVLPLDKVTGRTDLSGVADWSEFSSALIASPNYFGVIEDLSSFADTIHSGDSIAIASVNPITLGILKSPGICGIDIAVGNGQVLGNKMNCGGPAFGFFASSSKYLRQMPGRLVGKTEDTEGRTGYVMTLQTREQHIRRERATSNICTNQALNALAGTVYLAALGKTGIRNVSHLNLVKSHYLIDRFKDIQGVEVLFSPKHYFNEFTYRVKGKTVSEVLKALKSLGIYGGINPGADYPDYKDCIITSVTEVKSRQELDEYADKLEKIIKE